MFETRRTTNASLIRAFQKSETVLCRPLLAQIERHAPVWVHMAPDYPEIKSLLMEGVYSLSHQSPRKALVLLLHILPSVKKVDMKYTLFDCLFKLQRKLRTTVERVTTLEKMVSYLDEDTVLGERYKSIFYSDWVSVIQKIPDIDKRLEAIKVAVGFVKDKETEEVSLMRNDIVLHKAISPVVLDTVPSMDGNDSVPAILDFGKVLECNEDMHRELVEHAVLKINTLEDGEDRVYYSSVIMDMTDNDLIQSKAAVYILENIDALPHSSQKLSLLIKSALTFEPHSELERKVALKWAEVAIQTRLRTSVTMEEIMLEAMQAPDGSFLKEQALQLAVSMSAVLLKQQWMSEREKGIRLALSALPYASGIENLKDKTIDILLHNSDVFSKEKEKAQFVFGVLAYVTPASDLAEYGAKLLLELTENLTSTTRFKSDDPSENDMRVEYLYRAARVLADDAASEQEIVQRWLTAVRAIPSRREQVGKFIRCLQETPRDRLLYTVAWENYDKLTKQQQSGSDGKQNQLPLSSGTTSSSESSVSSLPQQKAVGE